MLIHHTVDYITLSLSLPPSSPVSARVQLLHLQVMPSAVWSSQWQAEGTREEADERLHGVGTGGPQETVGSASAGAQR